MAFIDNLVEKGILKKGEVDKIAEEMQSSDDMDSILMRHGVEQEQLLQLKSEYFGIPVRRAGNIDISFDVLKNVPEESAVHYKFVPIEIEDGVLSIGIVNPDNIGTRDAIAFIASKLGLPFKLYLVSISDFKEIIKQYKGITGEVNKALSELETELVIEKTKDKKQNKGKKIKNIPSTQITEEAPVTKIVAVLLRHAIEGGASDIHVEPTDEKLRVRFRVDGTMFTSLVLPMKVHSAVVARIKILANLKLDEKRKPQDGRFSAKIENRKVDFRVSTMPTYYGEKVVMRILDKEKGIKVLEELGLTSENAKTIRDALKRPYGLVLLTGPTGSGKTTTLYSMLNELKRDTFNVVSLEDPIEYNISGISQSQIRPEIGYTFANGLRSILRQDPDIIMVGEIRDKETAQLAIQAALTGHLVLATLHTNNASGVVPRLVDMGVDPFLIAPTLILAIGQRLVRTMCPDAGEEIAIDAPVKAMIQKQVSDLPVERQKEFLEKNVIYKAKPTPTCPTGMRGRVAVYELLKIDREVESVILNNPVEEEVYKVARAKGMTTMKEDALRKVFAGEVSFEQINDL